MFPDVDRFGTARTPYAVNCAGPWDMPGHGCGFVYLSNQQYEAQMDRPDSTWRCPHCRYEADWNDDNYEAFYDVDPEGAYVAD